MGAAIRARVTCPHCWHRFASEDVLWISQHPDLLGDARLGSDFQRRFLPTRYTVDGAAIDARGFECLGLACPNCHLGVPRAFLEMRSFLLSVLGTPACGKSYFLASMVWQLRQVLPRDFSLAFADADPEMNRIVSEYEELQFLNPDQERLVALRKTDVQGDLYDSVLFAGEAVQFPRPFVFTVSPLAAHPSAAKTEDLAQVLCLYDNAGESFLPGADQASAPVTRHLAQSRALFFLFDPTQDIRFRRACAGQTDDPQMQARTARLERETAVRQDTVLLEAIARIRKHRGLSSNERYERPLVIVVTKHDAWAPLLGEAKLPQVWARGRNSDLCALDLELIEGVSANLRSLLWKLTPEVVAAAEGFAQHVIYIPISALGRPPEVDEQTGALGIRPKDIAPQWVETPLLYVLAKETKGLVSRRKSVTAGVAEERE